MAPKEQESEDWLGNQVENAVEDGFRVGMDDIATLGDSPSNRIEKPDKDGEDAACVVCPTDGAA